MIGSEGINNLVWVDDVDHMCYVYLNLTEDHNRPFPEYENIISFRNPNIRWFIDKIHSNQLEVQLKYIYLLARKFNPLPIEAGESEEMVLASIEAFRIHLLRTFEQLEQDEVSYNGKFVGYKGMLKLRGDRVLQYNYFSKFLPEMPPNTLIIRKLLEFYISVYPLRFKNKSKIKDFAAERNDLYVGLDHNFKVVTDVVLLPLIMKNDDESVLDITVPIELSPFGIKIAGYRLDHYMTATLVDVDGKPPSLYMSEFVIKEIRGILIILLEICFDSERCPKIVEFGSRIYSFISTGVTISRRKLEILMGAYDLQHNALALDILGIILDPDLPHNDFSVRVLKMIEVVKRYEQGQ